MCLSSYIAENIEAHLNLYLEKHLMVSFNSLYSIYNIFLSISMCSASSERPFSSFRHLKTFTRNKIDQDKISNMTILHFEKTFKINFDTIIDQFNTDSAEKGRRLQY